ncbi:MAG: glycan-binding surface protein, partial [Ferruginibacter sp.]
NSGTLLFINGFNFQGVSKITFPVPGIDTALSYTVNKTFTQLTAVIPPGNAFIDSIRVYATFGKASFTYPPPMSISSVSNENAAMGTTITVTGTNFIGINQVIFPGNIMGTNIQSISVNQLTVIVPTGITTTDSLRMKGALGSVTSPQLFDSYITHPSPGYLSTFEAQYAGDNTGFVGWTGGYSDASTASKSYPGGTGATGVLLQQSPMGGNSSPTNQGNPGILQLNAVPWVANTSVPTSNYSMKFEIFVAKPWSAGEIWISLGGWYGWNRYTARYAPWTTANGGIFNPSGWVTVTIPLSEFITKNEFWQTAWNPAGTPASMIKDFGATDVAFMMANDQASPSLPAGTLSLAVDNIRIVKGQ